ncbi:hypothetical protein M9458_001027, partial [Cirrhinus mrigala]
LPPQLQAWGPRQCVKGDPKDTVPVRMYESLKNTTHTVFRVQGPLSPSPKCFSVNIFNGSNGVMVPVSAHSSDTIANLQQEVLKLRPDFVGCENLIYNGKPVEPHKSLHELQVKPGATLITYKKCKGG